MNSIFKVNDFSTTVDLVKYSLIRKLDIMSFNDDTLDLNYSIDGKDFELRILFENNGGDPSRSGAIEDGVLNITLNNFNLTFGSYFPDILKIIELENKKIYIHLFSEISNTNQEGDGVRYTSIYFYQTS